MKKILFFLSLSLCFTLNAQSPFQQVYRADTSSYSFSNSMQQTADGGYILTGTDSSSAAQGKDVYLVKTTATGDTVWARTYGTSGPDYGQYVIQTADLGYLVVGTGYLADWNVYMVKTDANGDTLWTRTIGGAGDDEANSVNSTSDGGYIVCGYTNSYGAGNYDYFLLKMDGSGNITWTKTYGTLQDELGYYAEETSDNGFIVSGAAAAANSSIDAYVIKTDALGVVQWSNYYGTLNTDWAYCMREVMGGYALTGYVAAGVATDVFLIKTNSLGDTLWTRSYGDIDFEQGLSFVQTADSGYAISGSCGSNSIGLADAMLIKTDSLGQLQYCHCFGGLDNDFAPAIVQTADLGFALGSYGRFSGQNNFYLVKTDAAGNSNGNCNEINVTLQSYQRAFVKAAVVTAVSNFTFTPVANVTLVMDTVMDKLDPCVSLSVAQKSKASASLAVFPNPAAGIFCLEATAISSPLVAVRMVNLLGETVYSKNYSNHTGTIREEINLTQLPAGTYFVYLRSGETVRTTKLVLQK